MHVFLMSCYILKINLIVVGYFKSLFEIYFRSVSFIMATGSLAFALMSICYFVIDDKKLWTGAPFYYAGKQWLSVDFLNYIYVNDV